MKILFLDAYFYPENIAFTHLEQDIMEGLIGAGHEITVICPTPTRGISKQTRDNYKKLKHETINGVEVERFPAPGEGKNPLIRAFRYFWCHFRGDMLAKRRRDVDAVFAVSTPPTQGYFAGKVAKKLGVPLIYSLQDVFPDSLVTTGLARKDSLLYRIGARIERKTYARCAAIIVLSETVRQNLIRKGVPEDRLRTVSNWIDTDAVKPVPKSDNRLYGEFGLDREKFTVVYAGNLGASQGTDVILQAAELLKNRSGIAFVIFGGGSEYDRTKALIHSQKLTNLAMFPLLPPERVSEVYSLGDVALITAKKGVGKTAMPSKLWSIMACSTPIIASFDTDSELAEILRDAHAGSCVEPENAAALAQAIEAAYRNKRAEDAPAQLTVRSYAESRASKKNCVEAYVECIVKGSI